MHAACACVMLKDCSVLFSQVTDAQLHTSAVPGSRYQFRPSASLATPNAGLISGVPGISGAYGRTASPGLSGMTGHKVGKQPYISSSFTPKTASPVRGRQEFNNLTNSTVSNGNGMPR